MRQPLLTITLALSLLACAQPSSPSAPAEAPASAPQLTDSPRDAQAPQPAPADMGAAPIPSDPAPADPAPADPATPDDAPSPDDAERARWEDLARRCADCEESGPPPTLDQVVSVETQVFAQEMGMGTTVQIRCMPVNAQGAMMEELALPSQIYYSPASAMEQVQDGAWRAMAPGNVQITCAAPSLGLRDASPASVMIKPGAAHSTQAALSRPQISAGERVYVQCAAQDAFGYAVPTDEAVIKVTPSGEGVVIDGDTLTIKQAGDFLVTCELEGAAEVFAEPLSVSPGAPTSLTISAQNARAAYKVGDRLDLDFQSADHWLNPLPTINVLLQSHPAARQEGCCAVVFTRPGRHTLTFRSGTSSATLDALVDDGAPQVTCGLLEGVTPLEAPDGTTRRFEGVATDTSGIAQIKVQGRPATLIPSGDGQRVRWQADLTLRPGALLAPIEVTDNLGNKTSRLCSRWVSTQPPLAPNATLERAAQLHLSPDLLDDRDRQGDPDSVGDLLQRALNSPAALEAIRAQVRQHYRIIPGKCWDESFGVCWFSAGLNQTDFRPGAPQLQLTPEAGGFRVSLRMDNIRTALEAYGRVAQIYTFKLTGDLTLDLALTGHLRLSFENDTLKLSLRDVETRVGDIYTDIDGDDAILDLLAPILEFAIDRDQDFVSAAVADNLSDIIQSSANELFAGLALPDTDNLDTAPGVMTGLSDARLQAQGMTLSLDTSFAARIPRFSAPAPSIAPDQGARLSIQEAALNQQLAALWRAGLLEGALHNAIGQIDLGNDTRGLHFDLKLHHAPAIELTRGANDRVEARVHVLSATLTLRDPASLGAAGSLPANTTFSVGAQLGLRLELDDQGRLRLREAAMQRLAMTPDAPLPPSLRLDADGLSRLLTPLLRAALGQALDANPVTLPVPTLEVSAMARRLGIPAGALVVTPTALALEPGQIVIDIDLTHRAARP